VYVSSLAVKDFRCFEEAGVELNYPGRPETGDRGTARLPNVNLLLGDNGSGKSSVFQAIALGVLAPVISSSGFHADHLVRRRPTRSLLPETQFPREVDHATVDVQLRLDAADIDIASVAHPELRNNLEVRREAIASTPIEVTGTIQIRRTEDFEELKWVTSGGWLAEALWKPLYVSDSQAYFVVAYGANRRTERPEGYSEGNRNPRYQRVAGLFEDHVGLVPFRYAYLQLKDLERLIEARRVLNALLPEEMQLTDRTDRQGRPLFARTGIYIPFEALSDGYRAFVGWVWDLLFQMARLQTSGTVAIPLTKVPGVVIVDEIDLFLHPEWQRRVVEQIATAFPRIQFLFSSHSPLVAGALEAGNIFVLDQGRVEQYEETIYGLTANQVLTSSYFGLPSTRAPGTGTLETMVLGMRTNGAKAVTSEQANVADLALAPQERARQMLEEIGDE